MKVEQIMEKEVVTCSPDDTLDSAAMLMWNHDCGAVPIVGEDGQPIGIITDRDIAMASALQHKALWQIRTQEVANGKQLITCESDADAQTAMRKMGDNGVRRLLVVDRDGRIQGMLSIDDAVCHADQGEAEDGGPLGYEAIMSALKGICQQQRHH